MGIEFLDPLNARDVDEVATLYEGYLGDSPVVQLGPRFLRDFFFSRLVQNDLVGCLLCRADDRVVAFLSWTDFPGDFIGRGIRRNPFRLSWTMFRGVLERPSLILQILSAAKLIVRRSGDQAGPGDTLAVEALSLVVTPEYQKYVPEDGTARTAVRLVRDLANHARQRGKERILYIVKPENRASNIFFATMGYELVSGTYAGAPTHIYTHSLRERTDAP